MTYDPELVERVQKAIFKILHERNKVAALMSLMPDDAQAIAQAALAAAWEWRPIDGPVDTSREIIALATDVSVYRMDTHLNYRGESCWQTWANCGFVEGYITHFVYMPPLPPAPQVKS